MAERPKKFPDKQPGEGSGSWGYDAGRRKITLRHRWGGKPYIERGETFEECRADRKRRRRDADIAAALDGDGTIGGLIEEWRKFVSKGRKPNTIRSYERSAKIMLSYFDPEDSIDGFTVAQAETMFATEVDRGMAKTTVEGLLFHWVMMLDFAERRNLIPAEQRKQLRKVKVVPLPKTKAKRWHSLENFEMLREHFLRERNTRNTLFMLMMLCGLRPGEARGLKWEYVDLVKRVLLVEGQMQRGPSEEGILRWEYTPVLKTDHEHDFAHREVPIPADLALVLTEMQRTATSEFVFIEDTGKAKGRLITSAGEILHAKRIAMDHGIKYVNPNGYRHTFASVCRHNGMPYEQLAKIMGHQDTREIIKTYGHPVAKVTPPDMDRFLGTPEV